MALFLITYDLRKPGRNYTSLTALLAQTWKGKKIAESVWLVELNCGAAQARDFVQQTVDPNDRIAVIELKPGSDWAARHGFPGGVEWLSFNVTPLAAAA